MQQHVISQPSPQHSPGPWRTTEIRPNKSAVVRDASGRYVATLESRHKNRGSEAKNRGSEAERVADGRLIIAAPAMKDQLRLLAFLLQESHQMEFVQPALDDDLEEQPCVHCQAIAATMALLARIEGRPEPDGPEQDEPGQDEPGQDEPEAPGD